MDLSDSGLPRGVTTLLAGMTMGWATFWGYGQLAGMDWVAKDSYRTLPDIERDYVRRVDHEAVVARARIRIEQSNHVASQLARYPNLLEQCRTNLQGWKASAEAANLQLRSIASNATLSVELRRLEDRIGLLVEDQSHLASPNRIGNSRETISVANQLLISSKQEAIRDLQTRAQEITKRLTCVSAQVSAR